MYISIRIDVFRGISEMELKRMVQSSTVFFSDGIKKPVLLEILKQMYWSYAGDLRVFASQTYADTHSH